MGTTAGTLWYINWTERASIRLVSGHHRRVRTVYFDHFTSAVHVFVIMQNICK